MTGISLHNTKASLLSLEARACDLYPHYREHRNPDCTDCNEYLSLAAQIKARYLRPPGGMKTEN